MKTKLILGILCVSWAAFALPAAAQNGRQSTPATLDGCDDQTYATPGLQGLCVALCEAQACEAEVTADGEVEYGPGCEPSAPRLLANYTKLAERGANNPKYPFCVKVQCPCWKRADLTRIGNNGGVDTCSTGGFNGVASADFQAGAMDGDADEFAIVSFGICRGNEATFSEPIRVGGLSKDQNDACVTTVVDECRARGLLPVPE